MPQPFLGRLQDAVHHYRYKGIQMVKSPFDIALYPLMIWDLKPRTIIEIGSKEGGSAIWLADQVRNFDLEAQIVSIDLLRVDTVQDPRVTFLQGNGRHLDEVMTPHFLSSLPHPWLVIEDADHAEPTSYAVLQFFHPWLNKGDIIVVEDGIMSDLYPDAFPKCSSGPHQALKRFLAEAGSAYVIESRYCDFFGYNVTWSSNGILRRTSP
jgi:cephalosporin hydroxylase